MHRNLTLIGLAISLASGLPAFMARAADAPAAKSAVNTKAATREIARGRYMVLTGHCNNCHTAGYASNQGKIPEEKWLLGSGPLGWRGPWGTTYASNLRLSVNAMTEAQWVKYIKDLKSRPPMPFWSTAATTPQDLRAMYRYIRQLGPAGAPAGEYLPPDKEPKPPFIQYPTPPK